MRGTFAPSDRAREITKSQSFTKPSRVLARFSVGGGNLDLANADSLVTIPKSWLDERIDLARVYAEI